MKDRKEVLEERRTWRRWQGLIKGIGEGVKVPGKVANEESGKVSKEERRVRKSIGGGVDAPGKVAEEGRRSKGRYRRSGRGARE